MDVTSNRSCIYKLVLCGRWWLYYRRGLYVFDSGANFVEVAAALRRACPLKRLNRCLIRIACIYLKILLFVSFRLKQTPLTHGSDRGMVFEIY